MSVHLPVDAALGYLLWYSLIVFRLRALVALKDELSVLRHYIPLTAVADSVFVIIQFAYETLTELSLIGDFVSLSINRCLHFLFYYAVSKHLLLVCLRHSHEKLTNLWMKFYYQISCLYSHFWLIRYSRDVDILSNYPVGLVHCDHGGDFFSIELTEISIIWN